MIFPNPVIKGCLREFDILSGLYREIFVFNEHSKRAGWIIIYVCSLHAKFTDLNDGRLHSSEQHITPLIMISINLSYLVYKQLYGHENLMISGSG